MSDGVPNWKEAGAWQKKRCAQGNTREGILKTETHIKGYPFERREKMGVPAH